MTAAKVCSSVIAVGAVIAVTIIGSPAFASVSSVNVSASGKAGGTALSVTTASQAGVYLQVTRNKAPIFCPYVTLYGPSVVGNGRSPAGIGSVTSSMWPPQSTQPCKVSTTSAQISQLGTWSVNVTDQSVGGGTGAPTANQVTPESLSNVGVRVQAGTCRFDVTGALYGVYTNLATPTFTIRVASSSSSPVVPQANLVVSNVVLSGGATNCLAGQVVNGDSLVVAQNTAFNVTATVTSGGGAANPLWVSALP